MKKFFSLFLLFCFLLAFAQDTVRTVPQKVEYDHKGLYVPAALMTTGIISHFGKRTSIENQISVERNEHLFGFSNHLDDYLQFSPFVAAYALDWAGLQPRTDWRNRTAIALKGNILNLGLVYVLKKARHDTRPDGTAYSFPSGHTANAFAGATLLSTEYGATYRWVPYAAYTLASGVGIMRIANNKHYISDVLFGAGLGILSMKVAYWTHQYRWNRKAANRDPLEKLYQENEH